MTDDEQANDDSNGPENEDLHKLILLLRHIQLDVENHSQLAGMFMKLAIAALVLVAEKGAPSSTTH